MELTETDKHVIEACFIHKGWKGAKIVKEFPGKNWNRQVVNCLIKKLESTGSADRKKGNHWSYCNPQGRKSTHDFVLRDIHDKKNVSLRTETRGNYTLFINVATF